jgi:hypothetical protein
MPHEVFISYASHDKAVAEAVCTTLESRQIRCWIAPRDVLPGLEWAETIVDAIDESRVLVLVLSSSSNSSSQVIREVGRAASNGIPIIPFRIEDVSHSKAMDFFISRHHWLDALTPPLEKHLQRLADTVQQILSRGHVPQKGIEITEAEEKERKEAELAAKEREKRGAKEAEERATVFIERRAEPVKVNPLLKRWWLWAGVAAVLVVLIFVFQPPMVPSIPPSPLPEEEAPPPSTLEGEAPTPEEPPSPTPEVPPPVPSPILPYEDDFSDPRSGWPSESLEDREMIYQDDEYHILVKNFDWAVCGWNRNTGLFTDFALEIDARLVSGPEGSCYGVIFRVQQTWAENYYRFLVSGDGYYLVGTKTNDVWTVLQDWKKSTFINQGNSTNHLKVVCQGSQIEVYVNGHHLTTLTDDSFAVGYVGMIVDTPEPTSHVAFDNIQVYSPD